MKRFFFPTSALANGIASLAKQKLVSDTYPSYLSSPDFLQLGLLSVAHFNQDNLWLFSCSCDGRMSARLQACFNLSGGLRLPLFGGLPPLHQHILLGGSIGASAAWLL